MRSQTVKCYILIAVWFSTKVWVYASLVYGSEPFDNKDSDPSKVEKGNRDRIQTESSHYKKCVYCMSKKSWPISYCYYLYKMGQDFLDDLYSVEQVDFLEDCEHGLADVVEVGDTVLWSLQYTILSESELRAHFLMWRGEEKRHGLLTH